MFQVRPVVVIAVILMLIIYYQSTTVTKHSINSGTLMDSSFKNRIKDVQNNFTYLYRTSPGQIVDECKQLFNDNTTLHEVNIVALHDGKTLINVSKNKGIVTTSSHSITHNELSNYYEWFKPTYLYHNATKISHWSQPYYKSDYGDRAMHIHNTFIINDARGTGDVIAVVCFTFRYKLRKRTQMLIT